MSSIKIRFPAEVKTRLRRNLNDVAEKRYAGIVAAGKTIPWDEMRRYLEDRAAGKEAIRPRARKLAR